MKRLFLTSIAALSLAANATVKFPYPQEHGYEHASTIAEFTNCAGQTASTLLKSQFVTYMKDYYEEQGNVARIKFDDKQYTVSEGIGYAMIMCVYFSDNTKSYQSEFDKLWAYYQDHSRNGIMDWKISGFGGATGTGGATDAEEDVAFALAMAYYQFGDSKYQTAAKTLIANMRQQEFASDGRHKVGNQWDPYLNPSYVSPAAYEVYKDFDDASFWSTAITKNYEIVTKNANSSTGIPSGWADKSGYGAIVGNNGKDFAGFDYDAARAPWRWAWSYAWYGHTQAKSLTEKLATWVNGRPFGQLYMNMKQDGTLDKSSRPCQDSDCKANGSSIGPLSSVLIVNSSYQEKLNANYQALMTQEAGYFHSSLRLLSGLLMSGNMHNLKTATPAQPKQVVIPESCNEEKVLHQNSGAFGWISTTAVLTEESMTGVHMGETIQGTRSVYRIMDGVQAGQNYVLTFKAAQPTGDMKYLTSEVYSDSLQTTRYCNEKKKVSVSGELFTCEFAATSNGPIKLKLTLNKFDDPLVVSDLSLKASNGEELVNEKNGFVVTRSLKNNLKVEVLSGSMTVVVPGSKDARISVTDMQGRVVLNGVNAKPGANLIPLNLRAGRYLVNVRQGASRWVRAIQLAD